MPFIMRTSLYGRRFGLSSTGGLITSTGSTAHGRVAQMWGHEMLSSVSSSAATINNYGVTTLSSSTAAAVNYTLAAPSTGIRKEIIGDTTSTSANIQTSATTILFFGSSSEAAGSTSLLIDTASTQGGIRGEVVVLRALSATRWFVMSESSGVSLST